MSQLVFQDCSQSNEKPCNLYSIWHLPESLHSPAVFGKRPKVLGFEFVWFHFRALNISNSVCVDLFTLDPFQASGLAQVMSASACSVLSIFASQHDGQTHEVFRKLKALSGVYAFTQPSTLRSCKAEPLTLSLSLTDSMLF